MKLSDWGARKQTPNGQSPEIVTSSANLVDMPQTGHTDSKTSDQIKPNKYLVRLSGGKLVRSLSPDIISNCSKTSKMEKNDVEQSLEIERPAESRRTDDHEGKLRQGQKSPMRQLIRPENEEIVMTRDQEQEGPPGHLSKLEDKKLKEEEKKQKERQRRHEETRTRIFKKIRTNKLKKKKETEPDTQSNKIVTMQAQTDIRKFILDEKRIVEPTDRGIKPEIISFHRKPNIIKSKGEFKKPANRKSTPPKNKEAETLLRFLSFGCIEKARGEVKNKGVGVPRLDSNPTEKQTSSQKQALREISPEEESTILAETSTKENSEKGR